MSNSTETSPAPAPTHALVDSNGAIAQLGTSAAMERELAHQYPESDTLATVVEVPATARIGDPS